MGFQGSGGWVWSRKKEPTPRGDKMNLLLWQTPQLVEGVRLYRRGKNLLGKNGINGVGKIPEFFPGFSLITGKLSLIMG